MLGVTPTQAAEPSKQMEEFLAWDEKAKYAHIGNSIVMIGVVASQTAPEIARCIDSWYFANDEKKLTRKQEALSAMVEFSNYTPEAIILAVVEKACGKFKRINE